MRYGSGVLVFINGRLHLLGLIILVSLIFILTLWNVSSILDISTSSSYLFTAVTSSFLAVPMLYYDD